MSGHAGDEIDLSDDVEQSTKPSKSKRPAAKEGGSQGPAKKPRAKKVVEASVDEMGWNCVPPSFIYKWVSA